jgi:hypothetical protein
MSDDCASRARRMGGWLGVGTMTMMMMMTDGERIA